MLRAVIQDSIRSAIRARFGDADFPDFSVAPPENPAHGDYATNAALALAKALKKDPMDIVAALAQELGVRNSELGKVEIAPPGFINFWLAPQALHEGVKTILEEGDGFGDLDLGKGKKARVEYVSANPTGPIHIGNARGGPIGETIARVLEKCGYEVLREYIHNDIGTQVEKMGATLWYWYQKALGEEGEFPEGGYQGEYLRDLADEALRIEGRSLTPEKLAQFGLKRVFGENMGLAQRMGIKFDLVVKESELVSSGKTAQAVEELKKKRVTKEGEGALWFAPADEFLKDRESVIIRSTGQPTYFASDIAYHKEKFSTGYDLVIDILGSNHHGHVPKLRALTKIFGFDPAQFVVILYQYVRVKRGAEVVKMSKRAGTYVTAKEVLDEVGPDSMIFFLLMNSASSHLDFDLELAREQSQKNPVYYVQYAHARCASIFRLAGNRGAQVPSSKFQVPELLNEREELQLIKYMLRFPEVVEDTARDYQVQRLPHYAVELARAFHNFYEQHRVIADDAELTQARLSLVRAAQIVLENTLALMAIAAPIKM